jgi:hypothetical protein
MATTTTAVTSTMQIVLLSTGDGHGHLYSPMVES